MSTPEEMPATTGARIRAGRKALQLSQRDFGVLVGYGHGYISDIESDRSPASLKFLRQVASKSPLSLRWLKDGQGEMMAERSPITGGMISRVADSEEEYALYCARPDLFPGRQLESPKAPEVLGSRMSIADENEPIYSHTPDETSDWVEMPRYPQGVFSDNPERVPIPMWMLLGLPFDPSQMLIVERLHTAYFVATEPGRIESGTLYMLQIDSELIPCELHRRPGGVIDALQVGVHNAARFHFSAESAGSDVVIVGKVVAQFTLVW